MKTLSMWHLLLLSGTLLSFPSNVSVLPSFQSGSVEGSTFTASVTMDARRQEIFLTGFTYDVAFDDPSKDPRAMLNSNCYLARFREDVAQASYTPQALHTTGTPGIDESCRSITLLHKSDIADYVVVGRTEPPGLYATEELLGPTAAAKNKQVGFAMAYKKSDTNLLPDDASTLQDSKPTLIAGIPVLTEKVVTIPQAVAADTTERNRFYVAAMVAEEDTYFEPEDLRPNWSEVFAYGERFYLSVTAIDLSISDGKPPAGGGTSFEGVIDASDQPTGPTVPFGRPMLTKDWSQFFPFAPDTPEGSKKVYVAGMIYKSPTQLLIAGSTGAQGGAYGPSDGFDEDGFVTVLNPITGQLEAAERFGTGEYDVVTGICHDPDDPTYFFLVGGTMGQMNVIQKDLLQTPTGSLQAFIKKVNADTLLEEWTIQHGGQISALPEERTRLTGVACAVQNTTVYMVGVASDDAGIIQGSKVHDTSGNDDVFVIQYDNPSGAVNWIQQFGSSGDESIALGNGVAIDKEGNAVVFGDTTGPVFRQRSVDPDLVDIYGVTLAKADGTFAGTVEGDIADTNPDAATNDIIEDPFSDGSTIRDPVDASEAASLPSSVQVHQSGPNQGALYAAGFVVDPTTNEAIITGITYTKADGLQSQFPSCVVARIALGTMATKGAKVLGRSDQIEACRSIAYNPDGSREIIVVGNADTKSILGDDNPTGKVQLGFGMNLNPDSFELNAGDDLFADSNRVPYPQSVVVDGSFLYVASMTSNDETENFNSAASSEFPNWTYLSKYGTGFEMTIERLSKDNFATDWSKTYPVDLEIDGSKGNVFVGGLLLKNPQTLIAVGSTRAKGQAYGPADGDDEDGFITLLDPNSGNILSLENNHARVGTDFDDVVTHVCDSPNEPNMVFIVGATKGDFEDGYASSTTFVAEDSLMWFVQKINLDNLKSVWTMQGGSIYPDDPNAKTSAFALGCEVLGDDLYVAGTVENGAQLLLNTQTKESAGGDDAWVAKLDAKGGTLTWLTQFGSAGEDRVARGQGLSLDTSGNPVVYGDTTGALVRNRSIGTNTDIFLAVLNQATGELETRVTPAPVSVPTPAPTSAPILPPTDPPAMPPVQSGGTTSDGNAIPEDIVALQFGPDLGPSYAGGMDYARDTNSIYVTGATYGAFSGPGVRAKEFSSCFFARVDLPLMEVIQRETYGVENVHDACSAIAVNDQGGTRDVIILGTTDSGGLLTDLARTNSAQYEFALDLTRQAKYELLGGSIVGEESAATFPIAIVPQGGTFYTVSMSSATRDIEADLKQVDDSNYPDFTSGGIIGIVNSEMDMTIEAFEVTKSGDGNPFAQGAAKTFTSQWHKKLETVSKDTIFVSGLVNADGGLVAVGTTSKDGVVDGILARVNKINGEFVAASDGGQSVAYFAAANDEDDVFVTGACEDPEDSQFFYVVGATSGVLDPNAGRDSRDVTYHAVVSRIDVKTLTPQWVKQFAVLHENGTSGRAAAASAFGCEVVPTENIMYIAGTVENGATMKDAVPSKPSAGRDDIFVAQLSTVDGDLKWMKQVGSNGDDRVARGNPVRVDRTGNAIVFGDTNGDFFRSRADDLNPRFNDPFLLVFDKQYGIHQEPLVGPVIKDANPFGGNGLTPHQFYDNLVSGKKGGKIALIAVSVLIVLAAIYLIYRKFCRRSRSFKQEGVIYDASAADLSFHETDRNDNLGTGGLFRDDPGLGPSNSGYRDHPVTLEDGNGGLVGNFHKTYSDLPRKGREVI